ncbi:hypothetical protein BAY61_31800 (plasmid) [Prauserella marina]|uniref:Antitoxin Phd_YefM, type II toxin-antitoxin system n=1 Tax=Prauserella marina TaxID=530584 RepID=A0A222W1E2_9PSEU|nr:type II toxin-antitoxin system Phd/YefM family antitoxin [Prauserella marina]ASR39872.1 hypothetical protein BAY61_31800 [Prauserella marina]PWV71364.1 antitoxin Phd_YefM of type II toxin-antitoxin system [Prauserella marina]SDD95737.1 Antitoxin Phd_YefM, type II toxin-antitoxin system [Prauserella marina]
MDLQDAPVEVFRRKQPSYLAAVSAGSHVGLSRRGTKIGVIVPPEDHRRATFAASAVDGLAQLSEQKACDIRTVSAQAFREKLSDWLDAVEQDGISLAITKHRELLGVFMPNGDYEHAMFAVRIMDGLARLAEADGPNDLNAFAARVTEEMSHHRDNLDGQQQLVLEEVAKAS